MNLWTVSLDYDATGEGRTLFGWIGHADGAEDALSHFGRTFGDYFARGAIAAEGCIADEVIEHLFSPSVLADVRRLEGRATVELSGRLHFNLA